MFPSFAVTVDKRGASWVSGDPIPVPFGLAELTK